MGVGITMSGRGRVSKENLSLEGGASYTSHCSIERRLCKLCPLEAAQRILGCEGKSRIFVKLGVRPYLSSRTC